MVSLAALIAESPSQSRRLPRGARDCWLRSEGVISRHQRLGSVYEHRALRGAPRRNPCARGGGGLLRVSLDETSESESTEVAWLAFIIDPAWIP